MRKGYPRGGRKKKVKVYPGAFKGMKSNTIHVKSRKRNRAYRLDDNIALERIGLMCHENW